MGFPSLVVFGPQTIWPSPEYLSQLRSILLYEPRLSTFLAAVKELPELWPTLTEVEPRLNDVPGAQSLEAIKRWIQQGDFSYTTESPPNVLSTPLTIIIQIVQYLQHLGNVDPNVSHAHVLDSIKSGGAQGFCTGFLNAITLACSKDEEDVNVLGAVALRLAVCIGAFVDLDGLFASPPNEASCLAVRWTSEVGKSRVLDVLQGYPDAYISVLTDEMSATITVSKSTATSIMHQLSAQGLRVKPISLEGRFHSSVHEGAVEILEKLCESNPSLQFPNAKSLRIPLRCNSDAQVVTEGSLHQIALKSILTEQSNWHLTIKEAASKLPQKESTSVLVVGLVDCIPRSVLRESGLQIVNVGSLKSSPGEQHGTDALTSDPQTSGPSDHSYPDNAIAIIGMASRYPGADSIEEFWHVIRSGTSMLTELPNERFSTQGLRRTPDANTRFWGNFLRDADAFDHRFFKKSPREAVSMDPQQRLLLQVAYEAMESSGYFGELAGAPPDDIGCYVGVGATDYGDNVASHQPTAFSALGTLRAFISGKVSHYFGWTGPSITYDTACSSSAVAIHSACKAIQAGECSRALAGGVNVITSPALFQNLAAASFLSPTGASKAFDANADGYCRGEGAGLVVLKKLSSALSEGDAILGVIAGSAVNQNENCTPITVPHSPSQNKLYQKVLSLSGIEAKDVSFVEAHGTGTAVGDPVECESIRRVFGGPQRTSKLHLGSVKGNFGHTEAASGATALLKAVLMMQHEAIPVQANFTTLNPQIAPLEPDQMVIPTTTQDWMSDFRAVCINNYGAAGSNAAMILCQPPLDPKTSHTDGRRIPSLPKYPIFISAHCAESLRAYCGALRKLLAQQSLTSSQDNMLASLAFNLAHKQNRSLPYTLSTTAATLKDLSEQLAACESGTSNSLSQVGLEAKPIVLVFGGQTNNSIGLCEDVYNTSLLLRSHLERCDTILRSRGQKGLFPDIFRKEPVEDVVSLHCMLFSLQYSCAMSWMDSGLQIETVVGHSFGQFTALCVSGSLSLEDSLKLVAGRASLIQKCWPAERGSMISVESDIENVSRLISLAKESNQKVEIACYNGCNSHVLVGTESSVSAVEGIIANQASVLGPMKVKKLKVTHGFHSELVENILPGLHELAGQLAISQPTITLETCSEGQSWTHIEPSLVAQHSREPVYFAEAVERIADRLGPCTWLEAGSGSSVTGMVRRALGTSTSSPHLFQPIQLNSSSAVGSLAEDTANLWKAGCKVHFWPFHRNQRHHYSQINLPPYQFEKSRHWLEYKDTFETPQTVTPVEDENEPTLLSFVKFQDSSQQVAEFLVDSRSEEYEYFVQGHAVLTHNLCPASLYVELAAKAATILTPDSGSLNYIPSIDELEIQGALGLDLDRAITLSLTEVDAVSPSWTFALRSHARDDPSQETQHATGSVSLQLSDGSKPIGDFARYERLIGHRRCQDLIADVDAEAMQGSLIYKVFGRVVQYADYYRGVKSISSKGSEVAGNVIMPQPDLNAVNDTICHPLAIDNFIQVAGLHVNSLKDYDDKEVFVCTKINQLQLGENFRKDDSEARSWMVYSNFGHTSDNEVINDIFVFSSTGKGLVLTILGAHFTKIAINSLNKVLSRVNAAQVPLTSLQNQTKAANAHMKPRTAEPGSSRESSAAPSIEHPNAASSKGLEGEDIQLAVQKLLHKVADIPKDAIQEDSTLEELGIDSLMVTELLSEVRKAFDVDIEVEDFQDLLDIKSLCQYLRSRQRGGHDLVTCSGDSGSCFDLSCPNSPESLATSISDAVAPQNDRISDLANLVAEHLDATGTLSPDSNLGDAGLDSLLSIELAADIEKSFGAKVDMAQLNGDSTFGDLIDLVLPGRKTVTPSATPKNEGRSSTSSSTLPNPLDASTNTPLTPHLQADTTPPTTLAYASESFAQIRGDYDDFAKETKFADFRAKVYPKQAELVVAYVVEAFAALGCPLDSLRPGEKLPPIQHISRHEKVMSRLYQILEDASLLSSSGNGMVRTDTPINSTPASTLCREILKAFPQHESEHKLLSTTGSRLAECLSGSADPLQLLFRGKETKDLLEDVYTNAPMFAAGTKLLGSFLVRAFAKYNGEEKLRILELGAGTGGTTKYIVDELLCQGIQFTYVFTDLSSSMVATAKKKFAQYDCMEFMVLDIEKSPPAASLNSYHTVISTNCIHATKSLELSSANIHKMLRRDGFLCLIELTRSLFWFDLVFGLLEGWWLFEDSRKYVLAHESLWEQSLKNAGFRHVDWSDGDNEESDQLRVIAAFVSEPKNNTAPKSKGIVRNADIPMETVVYKQVGETSICADIYYPAKSDIARSKRPIALMIHGGGHVILSRKDIRPTQTQLLLDNGLLPVSVDYRLCPELDLVHGPMTDVRDAYQWARQTLPTLQLQRPEIQPDGDNVVAIGWSTGGHLAMTLGWTASQQNLKPPEAVLACYCPTDYEADWWKQPNFPEGSAASALQNYDLLEGIKDEPITSYQMPVGTRAVGGWMSTADPRSRIALHMNWRGQTLPILLRGLPSKSKAAKNNDELLSLAQPTSEEIVPISPLAQIVRGTYRTPTYFVHGTADHLIPWQQTQRTHAALVSNGVPTGVTYVDGVGHLLDPNSDVHGKGWQAVREGYEFLFSRLGLQKSD
ncbi:MAG: Type I Iterative PKS [Sclerophora amabilis]|nr:MAG: Type I Iterative PKS [Sclerophora amabilis]